MYALRDPIRKKILIMLREKGKMRYTDILEELKISTGRLNYHLRKLKGYVEKDENGLYYLTEMGRRELEPGLRRTFLVMGLVLLILSPFIGRLEVDLGQGLLIASTIPILFSYKKKAIMFGPIFGISSLILFTVIFQGGTGPSFYLPWRAHYSLIKIPISAVAFSAFMNMLLLRDRKLCIFSSIGISAIIFMIPLATHVSSFTFYSMVYAILGFSSLALLLIGVSMAYLALDRML